MKTKKLFSVALAIAFAFTASLMVLNVFAMQFSDYKTASSNSVQAMGSVQASAYPGNHYFGYGYATLRIDPINYSTDDSHYLELVLYPYSNGEVNWNLVAYESGSVLLTDDIRHINLNAYGMYGQYFEQTDCINSLRGEYFVENYDTGEIIIVPDIVLTLN